ncbi:ABC transporter ATP-binding protein [Geomesophilobacter sediminis]|uniref:ABC transporter ATP-binding protein n=1 Tax=Geomesophilobacter sediminis TaxID=2798584 RepID=A0A8J7IPK2_9BACT|nr:ABC transporter ATP-binding protein [Geomesophilobacter sediminis]MBJ6724339.1 ABC transporter ATP-binding protein [Geomesophilobacter sediminis]
MGKEKAMLLEAQQIFKNFGAETVLRSVSLSVDRGESVAVIGPSGSGKSTLISILGLLLEPSGGEVRFDGRALTGIPDHERSRVRNRSFGFIFQNPQLIGSLSVLDNVLVPARLARLGGMESAARKTLEALGLGHRLKHLPHQLSIGQKRRVAIARALILDPAVIFADEPTNDLDERLAEEVGHYLLALPQQGKALVMVTHDRSLADQADRVLRIAQGELLPAPVATRSTVPLSAGRGPALAQG